MDIYATRKRNLLALIGRRKQRLCAEKWNTSPSALSQIASPNGKRNLGDELARKIERAEGLPEGWFDHVHEPGSDGFALIPVEYLTNSDKVARLKADLSVFSGPDPEPTPAPVQSNAELIGMMSAWDNKTPLGDDEVAIPLYKEVELAAGGGATEVIEVPGRLLRFAKSTLREAGVQEANAVCATIKGRSMERLIMDGATIGIDTGTKHIEDGEIYAFDQDGMLRVKWLYRLPGGGVRVRSENDDEFPDEVLTPEQFASIRMLGWVFWWSTVRRRRGLSIAK